MTGGEPYSSDHSLTEAFMQSLTRDLGQFVAQLRFEDIPKTGLEIAKAGIADCFGVMVAGSSDPVSNLIDGQLGSDDGDSHARLYPSGNRRRPEIAALINGVAAHVLDYDDVSLGGHPSAVLVPAILATGEACNADGAALLTAYVAGFEVWAELMIREPTSLHQSGFHPTAARGAIAAAAACAKLQGLDAERCAVALAMGASMSAGLISNFGSMTKSLHIGRAAQAGVIAAKLAGAGVTASLDTLEHPSGFLVAFSPDGKMDLNRPFVAKNREFEILKRGLSIKRYPMCYGTHRSIDGALELVRKHSLKPDDISNIRISTGETQLLMIKNHAPRTGLEAKFSMEFAMAAVLVAGKVGFAELTDAFVMQPEVQAIFPRIGFETTSLTMEGSGLAPFDSVDMTRKDGTTISSGKIEYAKGHFRNPLSREQLWMKFTDCVGDFASETGKTQAFERLMALENVRTTDELSLPLH
jgi:2-methylcitrate dehydratase PrpD